MVTRKNRSMVIRFQDRADRRPRGLQAAAPLSWTPGQYTLRPVAPPPISTPGKRTIAFVGEQTPAVLAATLFNMKADPLVRAQAVVSPAMATTDLAALAHVIAEIGMQAEQVKPRPLAHDLLRASHEIVVLGSRIVLGELDVIASGVHQERWPLDEPRERGINGLERLRLIRDCIELRINTLVDDLGVGTTR